MTRLERSSLDYAIARLARGQRPESLSQLPDVVSGDAYSRAVQEVAEADYERLRCARDAVSFCDERYWGFQWLQCRDWARRIVRARLALYLRLVRRVEAHDTYLVAYFSEDREWARPDLRWAGYDGHNSRVHPHTKRWTMTAVPWRPLWTLAPQHEPGVTARQRRESA